MRLLSFLSEIETALRAQAPAVKGDAWDTTRMLNFHHGLARLTLKPCAGNASTGGSIFLQEFTLADGSVCLKASLNWKGSDSFQILAVYSTPQLNWATEASRIAGSWLEGPREIVTTATERREFRPLAAAAG